MSKIHRRQGAELDGMREAGQIAASILKRAAEEVRPGVSTKHIDDVAAELTREAGCKSAFLNYVQRNGGIPFSGHICISLNEEIVHGIGDPRRIIQNGDIVKIDVGIVTPDGWVGDNAKTVPVGMIQPDVQQLLRATEDSLDAAIGHARAGEQLRVMCGSVEKCVRQYGYCVVREFVGHGVGRKLHEEPQVPNWADPRIKVKLAPGMILAVEPMVNMGTDQVTVLDDQWTVITKDRRPSAHFEHTILITDGDPEILTPRERLTKPLG
ncbi:MAG: type I methionyl aminopeptidase [Verrucomicrobiales bacterium]